jgi:hypothetical protein
MEKLNIREKPDLVEKYETILNEYIEDKRNIFFAAINHLINPKKNNDSTHPNQNIVPTLCCISLIEKIKAIKQLAKSHINNSFNQHNIDKPFLENVRKEQDTQDIRKLEIFLDTNRIALPIVSNTGKKKTDREKALTIYINDLIKIFVSFGNHKIIDEMLIGVFNTKIQDIKNEIQKQENIKKQQEKHAQEQKTKLYSIINNLKGTGGLFGETRNTLPYFSNREKINIIQKLSPGIAKILQSELETELDKTGSNKEIDDTLIDILHQKYDDVLKNKNA